MVDWGKRTGLYDVKQASRFLGITPEALRNLVNRREIEHTDWYGRCRFTQAQLVAWLTSHTRASKECPSSDLLD